jgi:hypothetical protein
MATNTYVALDKVTVGTATPSITFTGISGAYTDLVLVMSAATTHTLATFPYMRFNNDSTTNYSGTELYGTGSAASSTRDTSRSRGWIGFDISISNTVGDAISTVNIMNYSNTTTYKTWLARSNRAGSTLDYQGIDAFVGLWRATPAAITSIEIRNSRGDVDYNFAVGSTFSLYGIRAEGVNPAAKATGGAIYSDSTYYYHVFGSTSTFTPLQSLTTDYIVVAGGGGSGGTTGGGGGAGGFYSTTSASLTAQAYTVTVGAGGAGGTNNGSSGSAGSRGTDTSFNSITRSGGGGGGTSPNTPTYAATNGGSGGGGSRSGSSQPGAAGNAGGYTPVEGYAGGNNWTAGGVYGTGGGGGAGGVGQAGSATYDGAGGVGATSSLITAIVNATGVGQLVGSTGYIAGGGGGANGDSASLTPTGAPGGYGGGGNGGSDGGSTIAQAGKQNTGSGAGGSGYIGGYLSGKSGGSGVVIVRYLKA